MTRIYKLFALFAVIDQVDLVGKESIVLKIVEKIFTCTVFNIVLLWPLNGNDAQYRCWGYKSMGRGLYLLTRYFCSFS